MTEEAKTCFEILKKAARFGVTDCQLCPAYPVCPTGTAGWNNECMLETAANLIESLSDQLEQVTRERDGLQMELDELKEEYYTDIHTARDPMADKVKQLERERDAAVEAAHGVCKACIHFNGHYPTGDIMSCCKFEECVYGMGEWDAEDHWQWRGVEVEGCV